MTSTTTIRISRTEGAQQRPVGGFIGALTGGTVPEGGVTDQVEISIDDEKSPTHTDIEALGMAAASAYAAAFIVDEPAPQIGDLILDEPDIDVDDMVEDEPDEPEVSQPGTGEEPDEGFTLTNGEPLDTLGLEGNAAYYIKTRNRGQRLAVFGSSGFVDRNNYYDSAKVLSYKLAAHAPGWVDESASFAEGF